MYETLFTNMKNSPVIRNDTQVSSNYPHHKKNNCRDKSMREMAIKLLRYFDLLMEKPHGCFFQVRSI